MEYLHKEHNYTILPSVRHPNVILFMTYDDRISTELILQTYWEGVAS